MEFNFKTPSELITIAAETRGILLPAGGKGRSLHIPRKAAGKVQIISLFYRSTLKEKYPPKEILVQDAESGEVLVFKSCLPTDFGINQSPSEPILRNPEGPVPNSAGDYFAKVDQLRKLSPRTWEIYAQAKSQYSPDEKALIREYHELFSTITEQSPLQQALLPYYKALSPDFFRWLEDASR